jgi:hypothetical protein
MTGGRDETSVLERDGVVDLLERYVSWREASREVWVVYTSVSHADGPNASLAHVAYLAALEREEQAARVYAAQIETVRRPVR